jgi:hypothetical protein
MLARLSTNVLHNWAGRLVAARLFEPEEYRVTQSLAKQPDFQLVSKQYDRVLLMRQLVGW